MSMPDIYLRKPRYKLFNYESQLALRELEVLLKPASVKKMSGGLDVASTLRTRKQIVEKARRLTYFASFSFDGNEYLTIQGEYELSCATSGGKNRQATRYGLHGIHEYKGKFNPQVVSYLLNAFSLSTKDTVLDPFCGSGTVLLEAKYKGVNSVGIDINPMAVYLASSKLGAQTKDADEILSFAESLDSVRIAESRRTAGAREEYLQAWLDKEHFDLFETIKSLTEAVKSDSAKKLLLCCVSNLLRDYSLQEPSDLRIRRRKSPMPLEPLLGRLKKDCLKLAENIKSVPKSPLMSAEARSGDARLPETLKEARAFDAAITSPPYATALPYIDTQRISLVWLGLTDPSDIRTLESTLIGSREANRKQILLLERALLENRGNIPKHLHALCLDMKSALYERDGFRRQAMPFLLYRYFLDMQSMFSVVRSKLKARAPYALIVGHNHTTLGGHRFDLDTPSYLCDLAKSEGWDLEENMPLDAYQRYGIHSKNAVANENLIVLRR